MRFLKTKSKKKQINHLSTRDRMYNITINEFYEDISAYGNLHASTATD